MKCISILFCFIWIGSNAQSDSSDYQTIETTFNGQWARTFWEFRFEKDGTYERKSSGHFGNTAFIGEYRITADTIEILSGNENSSGTINDLYLIENDTVLIDLSNFYDYRANTESWYYSSQKRYDILPKQNMDSIVEIDPLEFENQVKKATDLLKLKQVIDFNDLENSQIIRLINTLEISKNPNHKEGIYIKFLDLITQSDYQKNISIYYDWIPNRGMGFYFEKLQIELGGTPHLWSVYSIVE